MAERHPGWVDGVDAAEARLVTGLLTTAQGTGDVLDPLRIRSGIRDSGGNPGLVTLGANKITVNPFQAVIADVARPADGPYLVTLDSLKELPLGAAHASLSRIDLVVAEVTGTGIGFEVKIYTGESAATPQRPVPGTANVLELGEIRVPPVGTAPTLTDRRRFTAALNAILPVRNADDRPPVATAHSSQLLYRLDTGVIEVRKAGAWTPYRPPRGDTWHAASLQNKWVNYGSGYNNAAYTLTDDGWVHLRGLVKNGTLDAAIFTLPVGYRPPARELLGVSTSTDVHGRIDVMSDGKVVATTGSNAWISLDGLLFATY
jgi:hypothetical protein